jgi:hypothetical protein
MPKCPFCDYSNRSDTAQCEKCGAPLQTQIPTRDDAEPPTPAPEPGSLDAEILGLMQGGKKIQAIKLYRERKGVGLKEAKDFVESLAAKHGVSSPSGGGCAGVVLVMVAAGAVLAGAAWAFAAM